MGKTKLDSASSCPLAIFAGLNNESLLSAKAASLSPCYISGKRIFVVVVLFIRFYLIFLQKEFKERISLTVSLGKWTLFSCLLHFCVTLLPPPPLSFYQTS